MTEHNSISDEKAYEHARDILHETTYGQAIVYARGTVDEHRDTAPHEVLAQIAWDAYSDACDSYCVVALRGHFVAEFPTFSEYV